MNQYLQVQPHVAENVSLLMWTTMSSPAMPTNFFPDRMCKLAERNARTVRLNVRRSLSTMCAHTQCTVGARDIYSYFNMIYFSFFNFRTFFFCVFLFSFFFWSFLLTCPRRVRVRFSLPRICNMSVAFDLKIVGRRFCVRFSHCHRLLANTFDHNKSYTIDEQ